MPKKTAAQLDAEIAAALVAGPVVTITVHALDPDDADDSDDADDAYVVSDDGGEFDDSEEMPATDVQGDVDERRHHYRVQGRRIVLHAPERGWR